MVGVDPSLLRTRKALLESHGFDSVIAMPSDVDEKLRSGTFNLVILSVKLSQEDKLVIQAKLPAATRVLALETMVWPQELLSLVAEALKN
jgi:DNA-binding response OmpR family regulator